MGALSEQPVIIKNALKSDDTDAMISCLRQLGIEIIEEQDVIIVKGSIYDIQDKTTTLNARISGTTIRFILALSAIVPGIKTVEGYEGLHKRPIGVLVEGLRTLGAQIEYKKNEGFPPLIVKSAKITNHETTLDGDVSSQYFSALLMIAPVIGGLTIHVSGNQISKSYIDMTIGMMHEWGVNVKNDQYKTYTIEAGQKYNISEYVVEGDYSGAGYFFAIAALTRITLKLENLNPNSDQGDRHFVDILKRMGSHIEYQDNAVIIHGGGVTPISVDMEQCPDQAQTLSVLAAFADGVTTLTGVRSLRVKETERVKAVQNELFKMGIKTDSPDADTLIIYGGNPHAATIDTYGDHRMAMSFAVAASRLKGMHINNPEVVGKTFPQFWDTIKTIGITII